MFTAAEFQRFVGEAMRAGSQIGIEEGIRATQAAARDSLVQAVEAAVRAYLDAPWLRDLVQFADACCCSDEARARVLGSLPEELRHAVYGDVGPTT